MCYYHTLLTRKNLRWQIFSVLILGVGEVRIFPKARAIYLAFFKARSNPQYLVNKIHLQPGHCTLGIHAAFQMVKFCMGIQYRTDVVTCKHGIAEKENAEQ